MQKQSTLCTCSINYYDHEMISKSFGSWTFEPNIGMYVV